MNDLMKVSLSPAAEHRDLCMRILALKVSAPQGKAEVPEFFVENQELLMPMWQGVCNDLAGVLAAWLEEYEFTPAGAEYHFVFEGTDSRLEPLMRQYVQGRMADVLLRVSHPAVAEVYGIEATEAARALVSLMARLEQP